ncbi:MAG: DUF3618 domain-containing protein [Mycobacteriales bacterium]
MAGDAAQIEAQIEATRAELARTLDALAERLSPGAVLRRGTGRVRTGLEQAFFTSDSQQPGALGAGSPSGAGSPPVRVPRWDRIGMVAGAAVALVLLRRWRRARRG